MQDDDEEAELQEQPRSAIRPDPSSLAAMAVFLALLPLSSSSFSFILALLSNFTTIISIIANIIVDLYQLFLLVLLRQLAPSSNLTQRRVHDGERRQRVQPVAAGRDGGHGVRLPHARCAHEPGRAARHQPRHATSPTSPSGGVGPVGPADTPANFWRARKKEGRKKKRERKEKWVAGR